jgi:hypothetical protein
VGVHKRQYIPSDRAGFFEILRWRTHAVKFARWREEQLRGVIAYAIQGRRGTTSHAKNREILRQLVAPLLFIRRWAIHLRILVMRQVFAFAQWRSKRAARNARLRNRRAQLATA